MLLKDNHYDISILVLPNMDLVVRERKSVKHGVQGKSKVILHLPHLLKMRSEIYQVAPFTVPLHLWMKPSN